MRARCGRIEHARLHPTTRSWDNERRRCFGMLMDGRAQVSGIKRQAHDVTLLIVDAS